MQTIAPGPNSQPNPQRINRQPCHCSLHMEPINTIWLSLYAVAVHYKVQVDRGSCSFVNSGFSSSQQAHTVETAMGYCHLLKLLGWDAQQTQHCHCQQLNMYTKDITQRLLCSIMFCCLESNHACIGLSSPRWLLLLMQTKPWLAHPIPSCSLSQTDIIIVCRLYLNRTRDNLTQ